METNIERRKKTRFKARGNTFAFLRSSLSSDIIAARLVDMSDNGLRVEHMGGEFSPYTEVELDIVLPAGEACMQQLPGITIYDHKIKLKKEKHTHTRYCGIGFRRLTASQKSYVQSILGYFVKVEKGL